MPITAKKINFCWDFTLKNAFRISQKLYRHCPDLHDMPVVSSPVFRSQAQMSNCGAATRGVEKKASASPLASQYNSPYALAPQSEAQVAELADALASGASVLTDVQVRFLSWAMTDAETSYVTCRWSAVR